MKPCPSEPPRKAKFVAASERMSARHGGKSRLEEVTQDYSNIEPWKQTQWAIHHEVWGSQTNQTLGV